MDAEAVRQVERAHHGGTTDPDVLDFSANTNPETPPGTEAVYRDAFEAARRYPDDGYEEFRTAGAEAVGCAPDQVIPTAGGLAALRLTVGTVVSPGDSVLVPAPGFAEYTREVRLQGGAINEVEQPVLVDTPTERLTDHAAVIVCTPNNPTGGLPDRTALAALAERCRDADTPLLVDEAFLGYTDQQSLAGESGVIVLRSLTKLYGLPGIRAGYAVATGEHRKTLTTARQAWALGTPAAAVGAHVLGQEAFVESTKDRVTAERARLHEALAAAGYTVTPSEAPFLLLDCGDRSVDALLERCAAADIAIRDARTFDGLDNHVRVAVKQPAQNGRLLEVLCDD